MRMRTFRKVAWDLLLLVALTLAGGALSIAVQGCTPVQRARAECVITRAAVRCAPSCAACVKGVHSECMAESPK